jgi:protein RecA
VRAAFRREFAKKVNKGADAPFVHPASDIKKVAGTHRRWPTGIFGLDYATGGGLPSGRFVMFWGEKSSGKTTVAFRAVSVVQRSCSACMMRNPCKCEKPVPGAALWIDTEGNWDAHQPEWAQANGVDLDNLDIARPEDGEQAIDAITVALQSKGYDLIVVDSLAQFTPSKEIESSAEDQQQGLAARMANKGFRVWTSIMNGLSNEGVRPPTIIVINQVRMKTNVMAFVDPRTAPGGKGQEFAASIWIEFRQIKANTVVDDTTKKPIVVGHGVKVTKNKTGVSGIEVEFQLAVSDLPRRKKGDVIEEEQIIKWGKALGLIEGAIKLTVDGKEYASKDALEDYWVKNPPAFAAFKARLLPVLLLA